MKNFNFSKIVTGVIIFTLLAKLLGFLRELILSYYFGTSIISDAYLISQTIPGTIFQFVGVGLTTCFIPIYIKILKNKGRKISDLFTNQILTLVYIFSTIIMVVVWIFTPYIIKMFAIGFEKEALFYSIWFTRISVLSLYFSSMIYVFNSYLHANNVFIITAFSAIPNSVMIILAIYLGATLNIWLLTIGSVLAVLIQLIFIIPGLKKFNYRVNLDFHFCNNYVKEFFYLMGPVLLGVSVNEINTLIDRTIASQIAIGTISALTYANSLMQLVQGGIVQPIVNVIYPQISASISESKKNGLHDLMQSTIYIFIGILIPITIIFLFFSRPIIEFLFGRGVFNQNSITLTSTALFFYSFSIIFVALRELLSRYFYAYSDTKTPMVNAMIGVFMNIIMNISFSKYLGIGGLALATSISSLITVLLLWNQIRIKNYSAPLKLNCIKISNILILSFISGILSFVLFRTLQMNIVFDLFISLIIFIVLYIVAGYYLKIDVCVFVWGFLKKFKKAGG